MITKEKIVYWELEFKTRGDPENVGPLGSFGNLGKVYFFRNT